MRSDIELDADWDLVFSEGDFSLENSEAQEAKLGIFANKGDWRQFPLLGAGLRSSRHAPFNAILKREIQITLQKLNLQNIKISIENV